MDFHAIAIFGLILLAALFIPFFEGLVKRQKYFWITVVCLGLAFVIRAAMMDYQSGDFNVFLTKWVDYFKNNGGFSGLKNSIGNYNLPYLYFLALFSYSGIRDLYLIKLLSIAFDVVLAFGMMKLAGVYTRSVPRRLAAYLVTLLLPTVILNGGYWGQCDSIYVSFAILSLWLILTNRPKASMVCMALSLGFKLQAVFIMPLYLVLLFAGKIKFRHYFIFPLTYLIEILPAVLLGRPFKDALLLYFNQAETVGSALNYNSPSIYAFFKGNVNAASLSAAGIAITFIFVFAIFFWALYKRKQLGNQALLGIALLFVVGIPYLLPHMHDRYFFMADVLILLPAVLFAGFIPVTFFVSFASLLCYYSYFNQEYLLPLRYGAIALLGVLIVLFIYTADKLNSRRFDKLIN